MAQNQNRKQAGQQGQQAQGRQQDQQQGRQQTQGQQRKGGQVQQSQGQGGDLWSQVQPVVSEAREFIEGSPVRAAAIGAVAGGLLMTLVSTEKGRAFMKMAYDYANPMVSKYARDFVAQRAGDIADSALNPQH